MHKKFRDTESFATLKVDAKELNSKDNNPFLESNNKYVST